MSNELAKAVKEMEDAMTVVAYQHARLAENYKSAAEWLESHNKAIVEMRDEAKSRAKDIDSRIEKLVSAIGELLRARGPIDGQQKQ